jgi:hypothetical protein
VKTIEKLNLNKIINAQKNIHKIDKDVNLILDVIKDKTDEEKKTILLVAYEVVNKFIEIR